MNALPAPKSNMDYELLQKGNLVVRRALLKEEAINDDALDVFQDARSVEALIELLTVYAHNFYRSDAEMYYDITARMVSDLQKDGFDDMVKDLQTIVKKGKDPFDYSYTGARSLEIADGILHILKPRVARMGVIFELRDMFTEYTSDNPVKPKKPPAKTKVLKP